MLIRRIQTAVAAIIGILLLLFYAPAQVVHAVIALVVLGGAWEWSRLAKLTAPLARATYVVVVAVAIALTYFFLTPACAPYLLVAAGLWWLVALILVLRYPLALHPSVAIIGGLFVLVPTFYAIERLFSFAHDGAILLLYVLIIIWGTDVGAYFAGKYLGKRKLSPHVSPNKTWAGVGGGLLAAALIGVVGTIYYDLAFYRMVPLAVLTGAVSVIGDLVVSLFKREAGVKDSGVLFPGHGGILDRIDSITAAAPFFVAGLMFGHGAW